MRLGQLIRKWRVVSEISQRDLAEQIGIKQATLCRLEREESCDSKTLTKVLIWILGQPSEETNHGAISA